MQQLVKRQNFCAGVVLDNGIETQGFRACKTTTLYMFVRSIQHFSDTSIRKLWMDGLSSFYVMQMHDLPIVAQLVPEEQEVHVSCESTLASCLYKRTPFSNACLHLDHIFSQQNYTKLYCIYPYWYLPHDFSTFMNFSSFLIAQSKTNSGLMHSFFRPAE